MSEKALKFNNIILNKRKFHKSKEPIDLLSVNLDQIVVSYKFKHNDEGFKHFIGYLEGEIVKPLCIILPQMSGYIKYFENGSKNMSFLIKDDEVWDKYNKIWDLIKDKLDVKFHSEPVFEYKYLKAKVRELNGMIKANFLGNDIPKENMNYTCIACITIDSVLTMTMINWVAAPIMTYFLDIFWIIVNIRHLTHENNWFMQIVQFLCPPGFEFITSY